MSQHKMTKPFGRSLSIQFHNYFSREVHSDTASIDKVLAEELGVSPQAVYAAYSRVERDGGLEAEVRERWCR
ncbi:MAG: hypothetical protein U9N58_03735 [Thermodesulfobacteriota bacterium]|nr:hypothetical protein [Thermodesulfobacteriota bacterium]